MKKLYALFVAVAFTTGAFATENPTNFLTYKSQSNVALAPTKSDKPIISNGFYLAANIGFPSLNGASRGTQFGLNIGNQWMFVKNERWGIGMNVTWFRFGWSSYSSFAVTYANLGLNFLEFGPMFSLALNDNMALDFYANIHPISLMYGISSDANTASGYSTNSYLTRFTPGVRYRFKKLMVGFEPTVGSARYNLLDTNNSTIVFTPINVSYFNPTILVGFKF